MEWGFLVCDVTSSIMPWSYTLADCRASPSPSLTQSIPPDYSLNITSFTSDLDHPWP